MVPARIVARTLGRIKAPRRVAEDGRTVSLGLRSVASAPVLRELDASVVSFAWMSFRGDGATYEGPQEILPAWSHEIEDHLTAHYWQRVERHPLHVGAGTVE